MSLVPSGKTVGEEGEEGGGKEKEMGGGRGEKEWGGKEEGVVVVVGGGGREKSSKNGERGKGEMGEGKKRGERWIKASGRRDHWAQDEHSYLQNVQS